LGEGDELLINFLFILHFASGGPLRSTSLYSYKLRNLEGESRSLFVYSRVVLALHTYYDKTRSAWNREKPSIHFVPKVISKMVKFFLCCVRPVQAYLSSLKVQYVSGISQLLPQPLFFDYLLVYSNGTRMSPPQIRRSITERCQRFFGMALPFQKIRHLLQAFANLDPVLGRGDQLTLFQTDQPISAFNAQMGHSNTTGAFYGVTTDMGGQILGEHLWRQHYQVSKHWQHLLALEESSPYIATSASSTAGIQQKDGNLIASPPTSNGDGYDKKRKRSKTPNLSYDSKYCSKSDDVQLSGDILQSITSLAQSYSKLSTSHQHHCLSNFSDSGIPTMNFPGIRHVGSLHQQWRYHRGLYNKLTSLVAQGHLPSTRLKNTGQAVLLSDLVSRMSGTSLFVLPTGSGKTLPVLLVAAVEAILENNVLPDNIYVPVTIVVTPTKTNLREFATKCESFGIPYAIYRPRTRLVSPDLKAGILLVQIEHADDQDLYSALRRTGVWLRRIVLDEVHEVISTARYRQTRAYSAIKHLRREFSSCPLFAMSGSFPVPSETNLCMMFDIPYTDNVGRRILCSRDSSGSNCLSVYRESCILTTIKLILEVLPYDRIASSVAGLLVRTSSLQPSGSRIIGYFMCRAHLLAVYNILQHDVSADTLFVYGLDPASPAGCTDRAVLDQFNSASFSEWSNRGGIILGMPGFLSSFDVPSVCHVVFAYGMYDLNALQQGSGRACRNVGSPPSTTVFFAVDPTDGPSIERFKKDLGDNYNSVEDNVSDFVKYGSSQGGQYCLNALLSSHLDQHPRMCHLIPDCVQCGNCYPGSISTVHTATDGNLVSLKGDTPSITVAANISGNSTPFSSPLEPSCMDWFPLPDQLPPSNSQSPDPCTGEAYDCTGFTPAVDECLPCSPSLHIENRDNSLYDGLSQQFSPSLFSGEVSSCETPTATNDFCTELLANVPTPVAGNLGSLKTLSSDEDDGKPFACDTVQTSNRSVSGYTASDAPYSTSNSHFHDKAGASPFLSWSGCNSSIPLSPLVTQKVSQSQFSNSTSIDDTSTALSSTSKTAVATTPRLHDQIQRRRVSDFQEGLLPKVGVVVDSISSHQSHLVNRGMLFVHHC
jgi:DEAD/DEAH box helicase